MPGSELEPFLKWQVWRIASRPKTRIGAIALVNVDTALDFAEGGYRATIMALLKVYDIHYCEMDRSTG